MCYLASKVKILVTLQKIASDSCGFQGETQTAAKQLIKDSTTLFTLPYSVLYCIYDIMSLGACDLANSTNSYKSQKIPRHKNT